MTSRVERRIDMLEARIVELEQQVATLAGAKRPAVRRPPPPPRPQGQTQAGQGS